MEVRRHEDEARCRRAAAVSRGGQCRPRVAFGRRDRGGEGVLQPGWLRSGERGAASDGRHRLQRRGAGRVLPAPLPRLDDRRRLDRDDEEPHRRRHLRAQLPAAPGARAGVSAELFRALFAPRGIALYGASGDVSKNTARPQRYLRRHGYAGRIAPINRSRREVLGEAAYASLAEAPGEIDQAFIMVPPEDVPAACDECFARRVPVVTIFTDGFGETGAAGRAVEARLVAGGGPRGG